ncbi:MAG TPA: TIR domain-containing protein [Sphingomicrobium sp.]|jgi:adenylate cyclase|nr:TIR domain-containing protein [Sphingomicrobium sp.]
MADVFVSYARSDERQAERVAEALRVGGYSVWRDDELPAHRPYAEVIEERLKAARAVVVLWSSEASNSQWVRSEADVARQLGTLVQASLDGTNAPMPFDQIQCANLEDWNGIRDTSGWRKLTTSIQALAGTIGSVNPGRPLRPSVSICVLPFANMSGDAEQEYFSDGITEDITTDLSKVSALAVTARNTAFMFKGEPGDVCAIATKLGVSHVLEGSVRKAGERVRITAQLIDGSTGDHVWAERYDRDLTDIFEIQDELSKAIVDTLKVKLLPREKEAIGSRGTANVEAYNLYLMGRRHWISAAVDRRRDHEIIRICKQALALDEDYAEAWALMALAQAELRFFHGEDVDARPAAERALVLNPNLSEPHFVRARYFAHEDRGEEASAEAQLAIRLQPDSWEGNREVARLLFAQGRFRDAIPYLEKAMSLVENDFHSGDLLIACYSGIGDMKSAERTAERTLQRSEAALIDDPGNGIALAAGAKALLVLGENERAKEWTKRGLLLDPDNLNMLYNMACNLSFSKADPDWSLEIIERFFERTNSSTFLKYAEADPDLDSIRGHARFKQMIANAKQRVNACRTL